MQTTLYTIGHGTRKSDEFFSLLKAFGINTLVDVRTLPFSRFNPQYNQKALKKSLEENGINYVFMGESLGGRPKDLSFYSGGKINYDLLKESPLFKQGLKILVDHYVRHQKTAIMCSERKPEDCHRSRLIGKELASANVEVLHIDETGELKDQLSLSLLL